MAHVIAAGAGVGVLAFAYYCYRRAGCVRDAPLTELHVVGAESNVAKISSHSELQRLFAQGGKAVVYLTATW